ncbi:6343_t:CDS:1, partial [Acaulospora colombiana]
QRKDLTGVINNGEIYLFGGTDENQTIWYDDMVILDTLHFAWNNGVNATIVSNPRAGYAAVLLNDGRVIYIGGLNGKQSFVPMDQVRAHFF